MGDGRDGTFVPLVQRVPFVRWKRLGPRRREASALASELCQSLQSLDGGRLPFAQGGQSPSSGSVRPSARGIRGREGREGRRLLAAVTRTWPTVASRSGPGGGAAERHHLFSEANADSSPAADLTRKGTSHDATGATASTERFSSTQLALGAIAWRRCALGGLRSIFEGKPGL